MDWDEQMGIVWLIVKQLSKRSQMSNEEHNNTCSELRAMTDWVCRDYHQISEGQLSKMETNGWSFPANTVLMLDAEGRKGWKMPIIKISVRSYDGGHRVVSYEVAIITTEQNEAGEHKPKGIGLRFETPESPRDEGEHDYHHVQMFHSFHSPRATNRRLPGCPCWLPTTMPAILINLDEEDGQHPLALFLSMLTSLYGRKSEFLRGIFLALMSGPELSHKGQKRLENLKHLLPNLNAD